MPKNELRRCTYCGRNNWHERARCAWCNRVFSKPFNRFMVNLILTAVFLAFALLIFLVIDA